MRQLRAGAPLAVGEVMKPMPLSLTALVLAGCQLSAAPFSRQTTTGASPEPAASPAASDVAAGVQVAAGGAAHPELARVAGVRTPHPSVRLVNLALDPDPERDREGDDDLEDYCPDADHSHVDMPPTSPNIPDLSGKTLDQALEVLAGLGRYCVLVLERTSCSAPTGTPLVCHQSTQSGVAALSIDSPVRLSLQTDVDGRGTTDETHRVPVLKGRPTKDVLADLTRRGFTNVQVIRDAQCETGQVCWADPDPDDFQALSASVILHVRP